MGSAFISVQSAFRRRKQEKSHSAAAHSSGHIHLTTQRAHFEGDILCVVWQAAHAGEKDLLCLCLFSGVLDDVRALTGRGSGFIAAREQYQVDVSENSERSFIFTVQN